MSSWAIFGYLVGRDNPIGALKLFIHGVPTLGYFAAFLWVFLRWQIAVLIFILFFFAHIVLYALFRLFIYVKMKEIKQNTSV